jgi:hypothetical protein
MFCPLPGAYLAWCLRRQLGRDTAFMRGQRARLWLHVGWHGVLLGVLLGLIILVILVPVGLLLERATELPEKLRSFIGFAVTIPVFLVMREPWRWSYYRMLRTIRSKRRDANTTER